MSDFKYDFEYNGDYDKPKYYVYEGEELLCVISAQKDKKGISIVHYWIDTENMDTDVIISIFNEFYRTFRKLPVCAVYRPIKYYENVFPLV